MESFSEDSDFIDAMVTGTGIAIGPRNLLAEFENVANDTETYISNEFIVSIEDTDYMSDSDMESTNNLDFQNISNPDNELYFNNIQEVSTSITVYVVESAHYIDREKETFDCPICLQNHVFNNKITTSCNHIFCNTCVYYHIKESLSKIKKPTCPLCREPYSCLESVNTSSCELIKNVIIGN